MKDLKTRHMVVISIFVLIVGVGAGFIAASNSHANSHSLNKGFDQHGYNDNARIFVGTCASWAEAKGLDVQENCGGYANDLLIMKWNAEWDRGNAESWDNPPYSAWEDNEWIGTAPDGSGSVWHYKISWDQGCAENGVSSVGGESYCVWGQFAVLMDQGMDPSIGPGHYVYAHAIPNGYGVTA